MRATTAPVYMSCWLELNIQHLVGISLEKSPAQSLILSRAQSNTEARANDTVRLTALKRAI